VKFFGLALPAWLPANPALKDACTVVHLWCSWALVAAVTAHVAATLYHQWVLRDRLLARIWFGPSTRPMRGEAAD